MSAGNQVLPTTTTPNGFATPPNGASVGAMVTMGTTQGATQRQFSLVGESSDVVDVNDSQDGANWTLVARLNGGSRVVVSEIATFLQTVRQQGTEPVSCQVGDLVPPSSGGPSGPSSVNRVFVYQQGSPAPNPALGIFATLAAAVTAAQAVAPAYVPIVVIDPTFGSPVAPAGAYNLTGIDTLTAIAGVATTLTIEEGAVFTLGGGLTIGNGLQLHSTATVTVPFPLSGVTFLTLRGTTPRVAGGSPGVMLTTDAASTVPMFTVTPGAPFFLFGEIAAQISSGAAAAPVISAPAGAGCGIILNDQSTLMASSLAGAGGFKIIQGGPLVSISQMQPAATGANQFASGFANLLAGNVSGVEPGGPTTQTLPPGYIDEVPDVALTSMAQLMCSQGVIQSAVLGLIGDSGGGNTATAVLRVLKNGTQIYQSTNPITTGSGQVATADHNIQQGYVSGDHIEVQLILSAALVNPITQLSWSLNCG